MIRRKSKLPEIGEGEEYELRTSDASLYDVEDLEQRKVVQWRCSCFERLGFGPTAAAALALRRDVDRQRVEDMVGNGARLEQVVSIFL